jgi:chromate transporter
MSTGTLADLAIVFGENSLLAVGGFISVLPEVQRQVVEVHGWMDARTFGQLFALAQASPGPNMLVVCLIGWRVAGLAGALVATFSMIGPPMVMAYAMASLWRRFRDWPWLIDIQAGLNAVSIGLLAAAAILLARGSATSWQAGVVVVVSSVVLTRTKLHPLWVLTAGAALGALGLV